MIAMLLIAAMPPWLTSIFDSLPNWVKPMLVVLLAGLLAALVLWLLEIALRQVSPKLAAIAGTTRKEAMAQPLFYVLLVIGIFLLLLFPFLPGNTFGEDIKVLKEDGLSLIKLLAIILALWTAASSIAEEIDGRTALTLLSKPITRRQFILGKFLGILGPILILFLILGVVFLGSVSYKVVFDARENALPSPTWTQCGAEVLQIAPGLALALMEAIVITSISVAVSTRLGLLPNLVLCGSVFVLGHLAPLLLNSAARQIAPVNFFARLFTTILPVLDHFNMETAVATGQTVPLVYLAWAAGYCLLYSGMAMVLALLLFEDRDLA
jgi:ABC-type transport system involved in multi-copper enzyme maturation permease subunit